jgi:sphinganine-1-phosphate aldolase
LASSFPFLGPWRGHWRGSEYPASLFLTLGQQHQHQHNPIPSPIPHHTLIAPPANTPRLRNALLFLFVLRWTRRALWKLRGRGLLGTLAEIYADVRRVLYGWFLRMPGVRSQVRRQVDEALAGMQSKLVPAGGTRYLTLPKEGWAEDDVRKELEALATMDHTRWEDGYVSGAVYHGEDELLKLQTEAYGKFTVANPIHPDVFPGVRKMEAEVVAMVLSLFNAPPGAAGVSTSGGTESILMACLSARQKAYVERGVTEPEM